ncbi:hypothetical protein Tco_0985007 [Tanacetum coccineum]
MDFVHFSILKLEIHSLMIQIPNSFNDPPNVFNHPPQPQYESYLCELCGNDSHYGYDCPPRFPLIYEQELSYNQNFSDNYYPQNSSSCPQQYLCYENCGGPHESFQCQPMNQTYFEHNSNYSGFDQPPQYSINRQEDLYQQGINDVHDRWDKMIESGNKLIQFLCEKFSTQKQAASIDQSPLKKQDEFIKSSVEDLVPIPSKSEDTSESDSDCDLPLCDDPSPINVYEEKSMTFSNPLFDSNDDFTFSDDKSLSDEDVPEENNIESKESYVSNFDESALLVTPLFDANKDECFDPGGEIDEIDDFLDFDVSTDIEDGYHDLEGDIIYLESLLFDDTIPNLPPEVFLDHDPKNLKDGPDNKDLKRINKVFDPEIHEKTFSPTYDCPDYEESRARGFVHRLLDLQSFACLYMGIRYPRSY